MCKIKHKRVGSLLNPRAVEGIIVLSNQSKDPKDSINEYLCSVCHKVSSINKETFKMPDF